MQEAAVFHPYTLWEMQKFQHGIISDAWWANNHWEAHRYRIIDDYLHVCWNLLGMQSGEKELRERRKAKLAEKARKQQLRDAAWGDDDPEDEWSSQTSCICDWDRPFTCVDQYEWNEEWEGRTDGSLRSIEARQISVWLSRIAQYCFVIILLSARGSPNELALPSLKQPVEWNSQFDRLSTSPQMTPDLEFHSVCA